MTNTERIDQIIAEIRRSFEKPNYKPQASQQMRVRADNIRAMANTARMLGQRVKPEYEPLTENEYADRD